MRNLDYITSKENVHIGKFVIGGVVPSRTNVHFGGRCESGARECMYCSGGGVSR